MKSIRTQYGESFSADFEESTWTFKMDNEEFRMRAGNFAIVDKDVYDKLISTIKSLCLSIKAHPDFTGEENNEWTDLTNISAEVLRATITED